MRILSVLILAIVTPFCGAPTSGDVGVPSGVRRDATQYEKEANAVGMDVLVHVFDLKTYRERVLPAYQSFLRRDEPEKLVALLRECIERVEAYPSIAEQHLWSKDSIEKDIGIITGTVYYSPDSGKTSNQGDRKSTHKVRRDYARKRLGSKIVGALCVCYGRGVNPELDMSSSRLRAYLYRESEWISDVFTFARTIHGPRLELSIGESTELFSEGDIREFGAELAEIPVPEDPEVRREYDNLRLMLELASKDADLTLALSVV